MKDRFLEIYDSNIVHTSFLDKRTVLKCMEDSYNLGTNDFIEWLSKMDYLTDNLKYIIEEYKKQKSIKL